MNEINWMFYKCSSISLIPDISKWNIIKIKEIQKLFDECSSLPSLPNISKWNVNNINKIIYNSSLLNALSHQSK